jgi:hypothetical protein
MVPVATPAVTALPTAVDVPAGELSDALELLAKQVGADIVYQADALRGLKSAGMSGTVVPMDAFRKLLEGTPLALAEVGGALLITQSHGAAGLAPADFIDEVEILAQRERLSALRKAVVEIEERFFAEYNPLTVNKDYRVYCQRRWQGAGAAHECRPAFMDTSVRYFGSGFPNLGSTWRSDPAYFRIWREMPDYQRHMVDLVSQHPELMDLLKERSDLAQRYEIVRKQKLKGRLFVWD